MRADGPTSKLGNTLQTDLFSENDKVSTNKSNKSSRCDQTPNELRLELEQVKMLNKKLIDKNTILNERLEKVSQNTRLTKLLNSEINSPNAINNGICVN